MEKKKGICGRRYVRPACEAVSLSAGSPLVNASVPVDEVKVKGWSDEAYGSSTKLEDKTVNPFGGSSPW